MDLKPAFSLKSPISSKPGRTKSSLKAPKISLKPLSVGKPGGSKLPKLGSTGLKPSTGLPKITLPLAAKGFSVKSSGLLKPIKTRVLDSGSNPLLNRFLSKKQVKTDEIRVREREETPAEKSEIPVSLSAKKPEAAEQLEEAIMLGSKSERESTAPKFTPEPVPINQPLSYQEHQKLLREQNLLPAVRQPLSGYLKGCFLSVVEEMNRIRDSMNSLENKLANIEKDGFKEEQTTLLLASSWPAKQGENPQEKESWLPISGSLIPDSLTKPLVPSEQDWENTSLPPRRDGTWKETIVNLKVMASTEDALQYSQKRVLEKDSGLFPIEKMAMLTELPGRKTQSSAKSGKNPFTQVEDQLRRIHTMIDAHEHEQEKLEYEIISPQEEETLSFTSESLSSETPPEGDRGYEEGLEYSQRLLYQQLLKDLFSPLEEVQVAAAESLSRFSSDRTAQALMKVWRKTSFKELRSQIAKTLSVLQDQAAVVFFRKYLTHENRAYRMSALEGLYRMGTEKAVGGVMASLRSHDHHMRRRAATYVGWLNVPTALEELHPLLKDPNEFVRKVTLNVIRNLKTPAKIPLLIDCLHDDSLKIRQVAFGALREAAGAHLDFEPAASREKRVAAIKKWKAWYKQKDSKKKSN